MGKACLKIINHTKDQVLNIQVHRDAAICAQGIVYESVLLGRVPKYSVNSTIHIVTNNQHGTQLTQLIREVENMLQM